MPPIIRQGGRLTAASSSAAEKTVDTPPGFSTILTSQYRLGGEPFRRQETRLTRPDKRREIMSVAERLFTTRQFHEITTDEIAAKAGVGKGTIYRYFRDKEDLFFQTAMSGFDELCDLVRHGAAEGAPFGEQLLTACRQMRGFFDRRWPLFRMMLGEEMRVQRAKGSMCERWMAHRKELLAAVTEIVERGVAAQRDPVGRSAGGPGHVPDGDAADPRPRYSRRLAVGSRVGLGSRPVLQRGGVPRLGDPAPRPRASKRLRPCDTNERDIHVRRSNEHSPMDGGGGSRGGRPGLRVLPGVPVPEPGALRGVPVAAGSHLDRRRGRETRSAAG